MFLHVKEAKYLHDYVIWLKFNNNTQGEVDLKDELYGEVFEPLKDLKNFKNFTVDKDLCTIVWENGADLAPEFLFEKLKILA